MSRGRPPSKDGPALPTVDSIYPTRELDEVESSVWDQWVNVIRATRPFLSTDAPLLTSLVELECRKARARTALAKIDPYESGKRHPALTDLDNSHRDFMALLRELGLTPASVKNVRAEKRTKQGDKLREFIGNGGEV